VSVMKSGQTRIVHSTLAFATQIVQPAMAQSHAIALIALLMLKEIVTGTAVVKTTGLMTGV
jgi:hypothetical protein